MADSLFIRARVCISDGSQATFTSLNFEMVLFVSYHILSLILEIYMDILFFKLQIIYIKNKENKKQIK